MSDTPGMTTPLTDDQGFEIVDWCDEDCPEDCMADHKGEQ